MSSIKNPVISLSRILGMVMIILCHIIHYYTFIPGSAFLGQVFGSGVQLFFFISGYLYGGKTVKSFCKWYAQRFWIVSFPTITLSVLTMIILLFLGSPISVNTFAVYALDLEGVLFLNSRITAFFSEIPTLGHLWFTTIIMLCYSTIPLLQKVTPSSFTKPPRTLIALFLSIGTVLCFVTFSFLNITYFFVFIAGYLSGKLCLLDKIRFKNFSTYTLIVVLSIVARLALRHYFDNTVFYVFYAEISRFVIGTWLTVLFSYLHYKVPHTVTTVANWRATKLLDKYSFYIYLTHGLFYIGPFNIYDSLPLYLATIVFCICTVLTAVALKWFCDLIATPFILQLKS